MSDAARLTAGLLARKGEASPAIDPHAFSPLHGAGSSRWAPTTAAARQDGKPGGHRPPPEPGAAAIRTAAPRPAVAPQARGQAAETSERRIAMTVRLDRDRHLSLKLLSVQTRRSGQALLVEALDMLFGHHLPEAGDAEAPAGPKPVSGGKGNGTAGRQAD